MWTTQRRSFVRMTCTNVKERLSRPQAFAFRDIILKSAKQAACCPAANLEISLLEWGVSERKMWLQEVALNVRLVLRKEGSLTASCYFTHALVFTSYALPHLFNFFFQWHPRQNKYLTSSCFHSDCFVIIFILAFLDLYCIFIIAFNRL